MMLHAWRRCDTRAQLFCTVEFHKSCAAGDQHKFTRTREYYSRPVWESARLDRHGSARVWHSSHCRPLVTGCGKATLFNSATRGPTEGFCRVARAIVSLPEVIAAGG